MDLPVIYEVLAILLFILANGFFALSEFSVIASRRSRLAQKVEEGKPGAEAAKRLHMQPERFLATIQVGITLFNTLAGVVGGATLVDELGRVLGNAPIKVVSEASQGIAVVIIAIAITVTAVVIGELVPKYVALSNPERFARYVARPVTLFIALTSFISALLSATAYAVVQLAGVRRSDSRPAISEEEISHIILEGREKGVFDDVEERLIKSVFNFADSTARRAMTPRTDIVAIDVSVPPEKILEIITSHGYSRYPIYDKTIDNIVGILYTKDLIYQRVDPRLVVLGDLIRKAFFVPDSMPLSRLLNEFKRKKSHVAIVLDEFGGTAGLITLEDIVEELVGEIQDEYDTEMPPLVKHSETVAYASGSVWPGEVNELMNMHLPDHDVETMAGLLMEQLGRLPRKGETVKIGDAGITVLQVKGRRLTRLRLEKVADPNNRNLKRQQE